MSLSSSSISVRRLELQMAIDESFKCKGRGNFNFKPGMCTYGDSLDLVKMGFTINKQNQH